MALKPIDLSTISLRRFKLTDVDDVMSWGGDDRVTHNTRLNTFATTHDALAFIRDECIPHPWRRSICINDRCIGAVSVSPFSGDDRCRAELGYAIAAMYWGQGITTEAVKMAVSRVFEELPDLVRLQAHVAVDNKGSQRVLEKAGFVREGLLRKYLILKGIVKDVFIFSFLATDIPPTRYSSLKVESNF